jgi:hypothetical protein
MSARTFHYQGVVLAALMLSVVGLFPGVAQGGTILWDVEDWPDPGSGPVLQDTLTVDGDEVLWQFSGDTGNFHNTSPNDTNRLRGGTGTDSLLIRWRPDAIGDQISLEVSFDHPNGVEAVQLQLFDIDRDKADVGKSKWGDRVTIVATTTSGAVINPTFSNLGSTVVSDSVNSLIGIDKSKDKDGDGNALIGFAQPIRSLTLVFEDQGVGDFRSGQDHDLGVSSLGFTVAQPIPEPSAVVMVLVAIGGAGVRRRRRR